ncbi:MAG: tetratricopeptide repeat protein [Candidatus Hydrogenedentota bacterium]
MRDARAHLLIAGLLVVFVAIGVWFGGSLQHIREAEQFYRWLLGVSADIFLDEQTEAEQSNAADLAFDRAASSLSGFALASTTPGPLGAPASALGYAAAVSARLPVRNAARPQDYPLFKAVLAKANPEFDSDADSLSNARLVEMIQEGGHEEKVWELAHSALLAEERAQFLAHRRAGRLEFARDVDIADAQSSGVSLFNLFFGFRKVAANFVWMEVDRFWHMGMEHRMLPLMKTTVTLDPNFVDAYLVGAWHLAYNVTAKLPETPPEQREWLPEENALVGEKGKFYYRAVEYLEDGIRNNPRNYKLHFDLGFAVYREKIEDYEQAVKHLERAVSLPHERWVPRQLFICYELNGQYEEAMRGWQKYAQRFPENVVAPRFVQRNEALMLEERADNLADTASGTEDPVEKAELRRRAFEVYEQAREKFEAIGDAFARAHTSMIDAKVNAARGNYAEGVALLEYARLESGYVFDEASDMIIEYKQKADMPLTLSEQMAVEQKRDLQRARAQARARARAE